MLQQDLDGVKPITQEVRQAMWDDGRTTDDHGMHAVGIAKDQNEEIFYLIKNSWGTGTPRTGPYDGHIYVSENYMRAKLESFMVHKDGVPEDMKTRLNIK
jgi:bleomycin hydrolase